MLVLPISIAKSISIFQRNDVARDNTLKLSIVLFDDQSPLSIDAPSRSKNHLIHDLYPDSPIPQIEAGFPARRENVKTRLFENSIAPVEVLNQSPQERLALNRLSCSDKQRSSSLTNSLRPERPAPRDGGQRCWWSLVLQSSEAWCQSVEWLNRRVLH